MVFTEGEGTGWRFIRRLGLKVVTTVEVLKPIDVHSFNF